MREIFRGYYPPTDAEREQLWDEGEIVLDTNSLLNLYRYTDSTRESFVNVLTTFQERLWIPAQVGLEFHGRRLDVIEDQRAAFQSVRRSFEGLEKSFEGDVMRYKRHPSLDAPAILSKLVYALDSLKTQLGERETSDAVKLNRMDSDDILDSVTTLFADRVGLPSTDEELSKIYKEGAARYQNSIPPGYKDNSKGEPGKYGDLVLWKQLLEHASAKRSSAIFVTDDGKEDWWRIFRGQKLGARPELVDEYFAASGARVYFLTPEQFLREAQSRSQARVAEETLAEVKDVSTESDDRIRRFAQRQSTQRMLEEIQSQRAKLNGYIKAGQDSGRVFERARVLEERQRLIDELLSFERDDDQYSRTTAGTAGDEDSVDAEHAQSRRRRSTYLRSLLADVNQRLQTEGDEDDIARTTFVLDRLAELDRRMELIVESLEANLEQ